MVLLLCAVPFFWRLDAEEFHGDESHWISSGQQAWHLVSHGHLWDPQWRDEFYFYSQPQLGKLLIGGSLALAGISGPTPVYDYDWQLKPEENRAAGRVPAPGAVLAGRLPGALAGWVSCLLIWLVAARLGFTAAGALAAVLLASHPLWLANARRAGLDATALCLGLAGALAAIQALRASVTGAWNREPSSGQAARPSRAGGARTVLWWSLSGLLLGLSASTKYVGLLSAALAGTAALSFLARGRWRPSLTGAAIALPVAGATFVATNPSLYHDPLTQLQVSIGFLADQADGMRRALPGFQSPLWVAAEIIDRAVWPLGFPVVVDLTMPEPLIPGSYGTPVVAFGAVTALIALLGRRSFLRLPLWPLAIGAGWLALVYVALVLSVPTWWERWHVALVPPLALVSAFGLAALPTRARWALVAGQAIAALSILPSYLGRGWGALVLQPVGAAAHLVAFAFALATLVLLWLLPRGGQSE